MDYVFFYSWIRVFCGMCFKFFLMDLGILPSWIMDFLSHGLGCFVLMDWGLLASWIRIFCDHDSWIRDSLGSWIRLIWPQGFGYFWLVDLFFCPH